MKKTFILTLLFCIIFNSFNYTFALATSCESVLLFELETQNILYTKYPNKKMYPASVTKIMTAIIALEIGNLDDIITVDDKTPYEIYGSKIALEVGEKLTLKDLLYALLLPSANDAAEVIAKHYGKTIENFAKLMNNKAKDLGCTNTHFVNPHGLHNNNHYTTAYDLMKITTYAMKNNTFKKIVSQSRYTIPKTNKKEARKIITTNNLLLNTSPYYIYVNGIKTPRQYSNVIGIKNGYTDQAKNTIVAGVEKKNMTIVAIILKGSGTELYTDAHNLFNYCFQSYEKRKLICANEFVKDINVENEKEPITLVTEKSVNYITQKNSNLEIEKNTIIFDVSLPITRGDIMGKVEYKYNGKVIGYTNIISTRDIPVRSENAFSKNKNFFSNFKSNLLSILSAIFIAIIVLRIYNNIRKKRIRKKRKKRKMIKRNKSRNSYYN